MLKSDNVEMPYLTLGPGKGGRALTGIAVGLFHACPAILTRVAHAELVLILTLVSVFVAGADTPEIEG